MQVFTAEEVEARLDYASLVAALRAGFCRDITVPPRQHHTLPQPEGEADATLLVMPAWSADGYAGVKLVSIFPDNAKRGLPSVSGSYQLIDAGTGEPLAIMDGTALTARRTAAVSALAAEFLARVDASTHLVLGAGRLCQPLVAAHRQVRPITRSLVWARRPEAAESQLDQLKAQGIHAEAVTDLAEAAGNADIISSATLTTDPILKGAWLRPDCHVDLVGAFRPDMREADDAVFDQARIFGDHLPAAIEEAGELADPLLRGVLDREQIIGGLAELCRGEVDGRMSADQRTVFKSVGTALADLAAARLVWERR